MILTNRLATVLYFTCAILGLWFDYKIIYPSSGLLCAFIMAILIIAGVFIGSIAYALKKYNEIIMYTLEDCDPKKSVEKLYEIVSFKHLNKRTRAHVKLDICIMLINLGNNDLALKELQQIKEIILTGRSIEYKIRYYMCLANIFLEINEDKANNALSKMRILLNNKKYKSIYKERHCLNYISYKQWIDFKNGKTQNIEVPFESMVELAKYNSVKVIAKHRKGVIYRAQGETQKAKECFEYVIKGGNSLYCVEEAKVYLSEG